MLTRGYQPELPQGASHSYIINLFIDISFKDEPYPANTEIQRDYEIAREKPYFTGLVSNSGEFDEHFAQDLLPLSQIQSEKQIETFDDVHLRQLLISHPQNAAIRLNENLLLEEVLHFWRGLKGTNATCGAHCKRRINMLN
ncbi:unnamed protein product [Echinostoma caproni]|uniref:Uncharacterized protein n=1 Tax=Echinostoma caproni TaxID=27848 RepID=A0A183AHQ4_9TREM|nr:unnamed protein product [Echinostoma caproni]